MSTPAPLQLQSRGTFTNWLRGIFVVLTVFFLLSAAFPSRAGACTNTATTGVLPPGNEANPCDLEVTTGQVIVDSTSMPAAWANVNIYNGGSLCLVDEGKNLDFWAKGILVENNGTLTNGVVNGNLKCAVGAFGSKGGTLTFTCTVRNRGLEPVMAMAEWESHANRTRSLAVWTPRSGARTAWTR